MIPGHLAFVPFLLIGSFFFPRSDDTDFEKPFPKITKYALDLTLPTTFLESSFEGIATISFVSQKPDAEPFIALHIRNIKVKTLKFLEGTTEENLPVQVRNNMVFIPTLKQAIGKSNFSLRVEYQGKINRIPDGLYMDTYLQNNTGVWYFASHLNPSSPDLLFPCSNDPRDKSIVEMKVTHHPDYSVITNTPLETSSRKSNKNTTLFRATLEPIPAYMVGLIAVKFDQHELKNDLKIPHKIWYRPELRGMHACAQNFTGAILKVFKNVVEQVPGLFNSTLIKQLSALLGTQPLKLDQVTLPYVPNPGVAVQWGLLTYREDLLLCDDQSPRETKQKIAEAIAYSLQRMSTALLPTGWRDAWILDAWATLLAYSILEAIEGEYNWEMKYQFIVKDVRRVMVEDASIYSDPLQWEPLGIPPDETTAKQISELARVKGAAIIRMLLMAMDVEKVINVIMRNEIQIVQEILVQIIKLIGEYKETRKPEILLNTLSARSVEYVKNVFPNGANISMIMENWIRARGYPVVYVNMKNGKIELSAKRYIYNTTYHEPLDNIWYIPISYTTSRKPDFENTEVKSTNWIVPTHNLTITENLSDGSWIVVNLKCSAYIRVHYADSLWTALEKALKSDHTQIHVLNRAQIIDDALELARTAGETHWYKRVISLLGYLRKETEYHPIYAAVNRLTPILKRIRTGSDRETLQNYAHWLFPNDYLSPKISGHLDGLTNVLVRTFLCWYWHSEYRNFHEKAFMNFITKNETIESDLKPLVYCMGLYGEGKNIHWNAMRKKLNETNTPSETIAILKGLACISDKAILKSYLQEIFDKESPVRSYADLVFKHVAKNMEFGNEAAFNFFVENVDNLVKHLGYSNSIIPNMLGVLSYTARLQDQLNMLEELTLRDSMRNFIIPLKRAIDDFKRNFYWEETHKRAFLSAISQRKTKRKKSAGTVLIINQILLFIFAIILIDNMY